MYFTWDATLSIHSLTLFVVAEGDTSLRKSENSGGRTNDASGQQPVLTIEKKGARNIGSKNKRLLMHSEDALELRLTWEEAQDLLRPPPSANPTIVTIDDHEFEEYDVGFLFLFKTKASLCLFVYK